MRAGVMMNVLLIAAGLGTGACYTPVDDGSDPASSEADQVSESSSQLTQTGVQCTNKDWEDDFYAEPQFINKVGFIRCSCFQPQVQDGITTPYVKLAYEFTCDLQ